MYNYYNERDYALAKWEWDNRLKPDDGSRYAFKYGGATNSYNDSAEMTARFYRDPLFGANESFQVGTTNLQQRYAVFSYCAESWSLALGQATNAAFYGNFSLEESPLGYDAKHYSHSKQFRSNIVEQRKYYETVIQHCGF